jgi:hypothetical protein
MSRLLLCCLTLSCVTACAPPAGPPPPTAAAAEQCKREITGSLVAKRVPCVSTSDQVKAQEQRDMDEFRRRVESAPRSIGTGAP